jgi:hypothetical protein
MSETVTLAGWKTQLFETVLGFLPFWLQCTILGAIAALLLAYWGITIQEKRAARRAARTGQPVPAQQGSGADHLGPYAPQPQQGSGADHLGPYAPQPQQGSGADYLGAYARPQQSGSGEAGRA